MEEFERVCCVRGYHVYNEIWEAATEEILICERELHNGRDRYAVYSRENIFLYWPRFLPFSLVIAFSTSLFARAIAFEDREEDNDTLGSGGPSFGLNKLLIDILTHCLRSDQRSRVTFACYFRTVNFRGCNKLLSKKFRAFIFRCCLGLRKYFNNKIFPNYGITSKPLNDIATVLIAKDTYSCVDVGCPRGTASRCPINRGNLDFCKQYSLPKGHVLAEFADLAEILMDESNCSYLK